MSERASEGCATDGSGSATQHLVDSAGGESAPDEFDVAVVGGGPAGASAAVFAARSDLDVVVFDRGSSSLGHCAVLENYPGFPGGIEVERFRALLRDHLEAAGAELREDLVAAVDRPDEVDGFAVVPQDGETVVAERVVAATRYDAAYLEPLEEPAMFETVEHHGETEQRLDRDYPEDDGQTSVDGLYVASPTAAADRQAVLAAGRGARVGLTVVEDVRRERGYPEDVVRYRDWRRREADRDGEWADRDRWREWFEDRLPEDHDLDEDELTELREREVDRLFDTYRSEAQIERTAERGQRRLLERLDDELIVERAREIQAERVPRVVERAAEGAEGAFDPSDGPHAAPDADVAAGFDAGPSPSELRSATNSSSPAGDGASGTVGDANSGTVGDGASGTARDANPGTAGDGDSRATGNGASEVSD